MCITLLKLNISFSWTLECTFVRAVDVIPHHFHLNCMRKGSLMCQKQELIHNQELTSLLIFSFFYCFFLNTEIGASLGIKVLSWNSKLYIFKFNLNLCHKYLPKLSCVKFNLLCNVHFMSSNYLGWLLLQLCKWTETAVTCHYSKPGESCGVCQLNRTTQRCGVMWVMVESHSLWPEKAPTKHQHMTLLGRPEFFQP